MLPIGKVSELAKCLSKAMHCQSMDIMLWNVASLKSPCRTHTHDNDDSTKGTRTWWSQISNAVNQRTLRASKMSSPGGQEDLQQMPAASLTECSQMIAKEGYLRIEAHLAPSGKVMMPSTMPLYMGCVT